MVNDAFSQSEFVSSQPARLPPRRAPVPNEAMRDWRTYVPLSCILYLTPSLEAERTRSHEAAARRSVTRAQNTTVPTVVPLAPQSAVGMPSVPTGTSGPANLSDNSFEYQSLDSSTFNSSFSAASQNWGAVMYSEDYYSPTSSFGLSGVYSITLSFLHLEY